MLYYVNGSIVYVMMLTTLVIYDTSYHVLSARASSESHKHNYYSRTTGSLNRFDELDQDPFTLSRERFHQRKMEIMNDVVIDPVTDMDHYITDSLYPIHNSLSLSLFHDVSDTYRRTIIDTVKSNSNQMFGSSSISPQPTNAGTSKLQFLSSKSRYQNSILHHRVQLSLDMSSSSSLLSNIIGCTDRPLVSSFTKSLSSPFGESTTTITTPTTMTSRNDHRHKHYHYTSTGTTIAGICGNDYIVIGADTRSTSGTMVADKLCYKLHELASNVVAAGAGTAADIDHLTKECYYTMKLIQKIHDNRANDDIEYADSSNTLRPISVYKVCDFLQQRLYEENGSCQANLIVGGVYKGKALLRAIHPHGSYDTVSYTALGSGGLAAMAVLENGYEHYLYRKHRSNIDATDGTNTTARNIMTIGMNVTDAVELVVKAISAGIINDLGSGSQIDIVVIDPNGTTKFRRGVVKEETLPLSLSPSSYQDPNDSLLPQVTDHENSTIKDINNIITTGSTKIGVNGFGNIPFTIKSRRVIKPSYHQRQLDIQNTWYDLLGLSETKYKNK